jgi:hypothetical protein
MQIVNFRPTEDDKNVGLKSNITFTFTQLEPFQPNSQTPLLPNQNKFRQLRDTDVIKIQTGGNIEAILYTDPSAISTTSSLRFLSAVERTGLSIALEDQIKAEVGSVGRVSSIRNQVKASLSNLISIKYKDVSGLHKQIPQLTTPTSNININTTSFEVVRATKGDILDVSDQIRNINAQPTLASNSRFTNFVMSSSEANKVVTQCVNNETIVVDSTSMFVVGQYITLVFSNNFNPASGTSERDVAVFKVKSVTQVSSPFPLPPKTYITLNPTEKNELLAAEEIQAINVLSERVIAIPGIPILVNEKSLNASYSLYEMEGLVLGEIPFTNLFIPIGDTQLNKNNYIGNLYVPSVSVILYENDQEVILVKEGKSLPGCSIEYKLILEHKAGTQGEQDRQFGDVDVIIKLFGSKQRLPIQGIQRAGTQAITVGSRLASTPKKLTKIGEGSNVTGSPLGKVSGFVPLLDAVAEIKTAVDTEEDKDTSEFYFNKQAQVKDKVVNLNKYGTLRINDDVEVVGIFQGKETVIHKAKVKFVLADQQQVVLDKPLPVDVGFSFDPAEQFIIKQTKYFINVPQTSLNPSRNYRIVIHAVDREDVRYDLDKDNIITTADQNIIEKRSGIQDLFFPNSADLNIDDKVDQLDIDLIKKKLAELEGKTQ